jgi:drug/metabolite transporter (DMT)-like permease
LGAAAASVPLALWFGLPARASYSFVLLSAMVHVLYYAGMGLAYRAIDLSVAYPLMRGGAPLVTSLLGALLLGESLAPAAWAGIVLISLGIAALGIQAARHSGLLAREAAVILFMVAVIVSYTLIDGVGARRAGQPVAFIIWVNVLTALVLLPVFALTGRITMGDAWRGHALRGLLAGTLSGVSYATALWAMTRAPIGLVAALRETSVIWAMLIGAVFLRETWSFGRISAALSIVAGLLVLKVG